MFMTELADNQLDANVFTPKNLDPKDFQYENKEVTDYAPWTVKRDPIKKVIHVHLK
jgi:hypothetical protein